MEFIKFVCDRKLCVKIHIIVQICTGSSAMGLFLFSQIMAILFNFGDKDVLGMKTIPSENPKQIFFL
jgi:hypothetical protein